MLSGMNSPSLLMLVKEPFLATCCSASGMYPGGGELRSVEWEPKRREQIERMTEFGTSTARCEREQPLCTYQSQHALLVCHPESRVVQVLARRHQVHTGGRVLEKRHAQVYTGSSSCSSATRRLSLLTWDRV